MPAFIIKIVGQIRQFFIVEPEPAPTGAAVNNYPAAGSNIHFFHFFRTDRANPEGLISFPGLATDCRPGTQQQLQLQYLTPFHFYTHTLTLFQIL